MIKKILALFVTVLILCSGCGKKEIVQENTLNNIIDKKEISIGVRTDVYPFGYYDKRGKIQGIDAEIARMIARGLLGENYKLRLIPVSASDRIFKLYSGDVDMLVAIMTVTNKRKEIMDFSDSYYTAGQAILVNNGSSIKALSGLKDKTAIIVFGSTSEISLRSAVPGINVIGYKTYNEAYRALKQNKGQAIVADDVILAGMSMKDPTVKLLKKKYTREPYAVAFRKGDESKDLIDAVNKILEIEQSNGKIKRMLKIYGIE